MSALPPPLVVPGARARVRAAHRADGRRLAVLDDDPTGSQAVHDVTAVLTLDPAAAAAALDGPDGGPGATCFVLTNTRSVAEPVARRVTRRAGGDLLRLARDGGWPLTLVSRSDSTLRGHLLAEVEELDAAHRDVTGRGHDGVLLVPAYPPAGRVTVDGVHRARGCGRDLPVGETEFARDPSFGYRSSDLRDLLAELSGGRIRRDDVLPVRLDDVRDGGPERVAALLGGLRDGRFAVVDAVTEDDLDVVALGVLAASRAGLALLHRTGPSFARALAGIDPRPPLTAAELRPARPGGHGLVAVGSHVGLTTAQLAAASRRGGLARVDLDVRAAVDPATRDAHVRAVTRRVRVELARSDVLLVTGREVLTGPAGAGAAERLRLARTVSRALTDVVRGALLVRPAWIVAKGGITSHDVAARALRVRRARVLGQLLPGMVSAFRPVEAAPAALGTPYVVFAGNVGDEQTLADVVDRMRAGNRQA